MKTFGVLNVVAHPHDEGTYRQLFRMAGDASRGVQYFGDRYATISRISDGEQGTFDGRLATWVEVDRSAKIIDTSSLEEELFSEARISIPDGIGLNSRVFSFAFNEKSHKMVVETRNGYGETLSINRARVALMNIFAALDLPEGQEVSVYVQSRADAVDKVLSINKLKKVEISLEKPNPDDLSDLEREVQRELEENGVRRIRSELSKSADRDTITLSDRYKAMANVAKDNGYVEAEGVSEDGEKVKLSTKEYPQIFRDFDNDASGLAVARRLAQNE